MLLRCSPEPLWIPKFVAVSHLLRLRNNRAARIFTGTRRIPRHRVPTFADRALDNETNLAPWKILKKRKRLEISKE